MSLRTFKSEKDVPEGTWYLERLGEGKPMVIPLLNKRTVLGSKILVKNAKRVSPEHVILQKHPEDDLFVLIDMGSKYGTYVNNKKLDLEGIVLKRNSAFTLGRKWPKNKKYYAFNLRYKEIFPVPCSRGKDLASDGQSEDEQSADDSDVNVSSLSEKPSFPAEDSREVSVVLNVNESAQKHVKEENKTCIQPLPERKSWIPKLHNPTQTCNLPSTDLRLNSDISYASSHVDTLPAAVPSRRRSYVPSTTQTTQTSRNVWTKSLERSQSFHGRYSSYKSIGKGTIWNKDKILKAYRHRLPMPGGGSDVRKS